MGKTIKKIFKALTSPEAIIAIAAAFFIPGGGFAAAAWTAGAISVSAALIDVPSLPQAASFSQEAQGRNVMVRQPTASRKIIYGQVKTSGPVLFMGTTDNEKYLHVVVAIAGHPVASVGDDDQYGAAKNKVWLNDSELYLVNVSGAEGLDANGVKRWIQTSSGYGFVGDFDSEYNYGYYNYDPTLSGQLEGYKFWKSPSSLLRMKFYDGTQTLADADLVEAFPDWKNTSVLNNTPYIYARFEYDVDAFANGIPNISVEIEGKKIFDPRDSSTNYSTNPALIIRDYIKSVYGWSAADSELDSASFIAAANVCDEDVTLVDGTTEKRYTCNGVIDTARSRGEILGELLTTFQGTLIRVNGKWVLNAGAYQTPTITLDEDDLRSGIQLTTKISRRDSFNTVRGVIIDPDGDYQLTDYPSITNATYIAEDGEEVVSQLNLPFTSSMSTAQRLAKIHLEKQRQQISLVYPAKLTAFKVRTGDTVLINNTRFGFSQKPFEVVEWKLVTDTDLSGAPTFGVNLVLRETAAAVYTWSANEQIAVDPAPNTNLPSAFTVGDVGLTVSDEVRLINGTAATVLIATVTGGGTFASNYLVEVLKAGDDPVTGWRNMGQGSSQIFEMSNVEDKTSYLVRAKAINNIGVHSINYSHVSHQTIGKSAPPANVANFSVNVVGSEAHLTWDAIADVDVDYYQIRFTPKTSSQTYSNSVTVVAKVKATNVIVPAQSGTYFVRAYDTTGNASLIPASTGVSIQSFSGLNLVATSTQDPGFSGAKTNVVLDPDTLDVPAIKLGSATFFDSHAGLFDDEVGLFDAGGGISDTGTYLFDNYIDTGGVYTSRVTAAIDSTRIDYVDLFDSKLGNFDAANGLFDGDPDTYDDTNVELYVRTTSGDPSGSPVWSDWRVFTVGDYTARAFEFKAILFAENDNSTPAITGLSVTVDMPDRVIAENNISSGTGSKVVTFSPAFKALQGLSVTAENLDTNEHYVITSKSATGFTITFYHGHGTSVTDKTFDYVAKGYGEIST